MSERRRCPVGMIAQILLERFIAEDEAESAAGIGVDRFLQVEYVKGNHLFGGLAAFLLHDGEMKLIVHDPVIGDIDDGTIFQKQLRDLRCFIAVNVNGSSVDLRSIHRGTIVIRGKRVVDESGSPIGTTGRPPTEVGSPKRVSKNEKRRGVDADNRRPGANRAGWSAKR